MNINKKTKVFLSLAIKLTSIKSTAGVDLNLKEPADPLFKGLFGSGQCSDLDKQIEVKGNELIVFDCQDSNPIRLKIPAPRRRTLDLKLKANIYSFDEYLRVKKIESSKRLVEIEYDEYDRPLTLKETLLNNKKVKIQNLKYDSLTGEAIYE